MARPQTVVPARAPVWRKSLIRALPRFFTAFLATLILVLAPLPSLSLTARAATQLWLPTPPGERWKIIQGYGCGTHNSWDRYSLDLANAEGQSRGAPVRAAADGTIFVWVPQSGTLILKHSDTFYTMYTHMESAVTTKVGLAVTRGTVIGAVGERGSPGTPHLHFTAFTAEGAWARNRQSVPLSFAEGYDLAEEGGCNQHGGETLTSGDRAGMALPGLNFVSEAQPGRWYNGDMAVAFSGSAAGRGYSMAWNSDPAGEAPTTIDSASGSAQLAAAGEGLHTLYVRAWGKDGQQTLATYGPVGYDVTPPTAPAPAELIEAAAGAATVLRWNPATDGASGVAGYRVYLGDNPEGTSEWFVQTPEATTPTLAAGSYVLRVQPLDYAGNAGAWTTVARVVVR